VFGFVSVLFLGLTVSAFGVLKSYQDNLNQRTYDESGFAALQLRVHYEALLGALAVIEYQMSPQTVEEAVLQFDILLERLTALPSRPSYDSLLDREGNRLQAEVLAAIQTQIARIDHAAEGEGTALRGMRGEIVTLRPLIERLAHRPTQIASERRGAIMKDFEKHSNLFFMVIVGFVATGVLFVIIIWRQLSLSMDRQVALETMTQSLQAARDEAEDASNAKSDFLAHMSHELRTPMNSVLGFAQILETQDLNEMQRQAVNQIMRNGDMLMRLIDQMLELNKIVSGHVPISVQPVSPSNVITTCLGLMESLAGERSITLGALPSMYNVEGLETDPKRLQQILLNLMSNAIKYNKIGGEVTLSCDPLEGDMVRFSVMDTGEGIPEGQEENLFRPFNRLGRETMSVDGIGIGLTIAHELAQVLEGQLGYASTIGEGSTFWIDLPLKGKETLVYEVED